ncbi:MAG: ABC transporter substrate-binding protein [Syntrophorhabdales bacterium]|jgi:branched-chain amino acid transport system substrate-binding protein
MVQPASAAEPIRIGALMSMTGPAGFVGANVKEAIVALVDDLNRKGGVLGRQIEVLYEDDKSNPANAVVAVTKLIRDQKVSVIIGPSVMDSGMAIMPTVEKEEVPFMVIGPIVTPLKKWVFLLGPGDARGAIHFLEVATKDFRAKRIAVLHDSGAYGMTGLKEYNNHIGQFSGASIITEERFDMADTNVIPQLTKIKAANPDLIILHTFSGPATVVAKNYKQLGLKIPVLGAGGVPQTDFLKGAGSIAEEGKWAFIVAKLLIAENLPASDPYRKTLYDPFKKIMQDKYGPNKELNGFHAVAYDGIIAIVEAIKVAGSDSRAAIRDAFEKIRLEGMVGAFACSPTDHQGSPKDTFPVAGVKNGELVPYVK